MSILPVEDLAYWQVEKRPSGREITELTYHGHTLRTLAVVACHFWQWKVWMPRKDDSTSWHEVDKVRIQDGVVEVSLKRYI